MQVYVADHWKSMTVHQLKVVYFCTKPYSVHQIIVLEFELCLFVISTCLHVRLFTDHINLVCILTCAWVISCHIWSPIIAVQAIAYCRPCWFRVAVARTVWTRLLIPHHVLVCARGTGCKKVWKQWPINRHSCMNQFSLFFIAFLVLNTFCV